MFLHWHSEPIHVTASFHASAHTYPDRYKHPYTQYLAKCLALLLMLFLRYHHYFLFLGGIHSGFIFIYFSLFSGITCL